MTKDEIVEITRQAGGFDATPKFLETFAKLVAQHEREACADLCKEMYLSGDMDTGLAEEAIRARAKE
jgi:hypothetical protein